MTLDFFRSKRIGLLILGSILVILLGALPARAQCFLTAWMGEVIVMIGEICSLEEQSESILLVAEK